MREVIDGPLRADPCSGFYDSTLFPVVTLFTSSGVAESISQFFVNLSPVTYREDPDEPCFAIDFIDEAKSSDFVFPQTS